MEPKLVQVTLGQTALVRCSLNNFANHTWIKNGSIVANTFKTFQTITGVLLVHNVSAEDSGEYTCTAVTKYGILAGNSVIQVGGNLLIDLMFDFHRQIFCGPDSHNLASLIFCYHLPSDHRIIHPID